MKGILLAGGLGTRMQPLTNYDNKHFLPVYKKRMIEYPLQTLVDIGIKDVIVVTGGKNPGAFLELLKNGSSYGLNRLYYTYQEGNGGIADALKLASPFMRAREKCIVILGDNYFEDGIKSQFKQFVFGNQNTTQVITKEVSDPERFGILEIDSDDNVLSIEEKPIRPKSNKAILGCYMFDGFVWDFIDELKPSERGELEITDILRVYAARNQLNFSDYSGYWSDMGTFESWMEVSQRIMERTNE